MKVIAQQGDTVYLIGVGKDLARVLDGEQNKLFPPFNVHSILARGYWENFDGDLETVRGLLNRVAILPDNAFRADELSIQVFKEGVSEHVATIHAAYENTLLMWEHVSRENIASKFQDSDEGLTLVESVSEELLPEQVEFGGSVFTRSQGNKFLKSLVLAQPSKGYRYEFTSSEK